MKNLRAFFKVIAVVLATVWIYLVYIVGYILMRAGGLPTHNWLNNILQFWGNTIAKCLSMTIRVQGNKPEPPFFLVSNHLSYVDIIVLFSVLKTTFVAKLEVSRWPVIGFIAKSIGIVFIDRKNKMDITRVNNEISEKVTSHRGLTLFPEGTTSPGAAILRFRASLLEYPARSRLGVHFCTLHYQTSSITNSAHNIVCWWRDISMFSHLFTLAKEKSIHATITFGEKGLHDEDRKILAKNLHENMSALFTPMCKEAEDSFEPVQL